MTQKIISVPKREVVPTPKEKFEVVIDRLPAPRCSCKGNNTRARAEALERAEMAREIGCDKLADAAMRHAQIHEPTLSVAMQPTISPPAQMTLGPIKFRVKNYLE